MIEVRPLARDEVAARLDEIAGLRIAVFREWPYLYDGDLDYERRYLRPYVESEAALVVGALDDGRLIGVSNATPMEDHAGDFAVRLLGADEFDDVFGGQGFEVEPVGGVVIGRNVFRVAVDHDGLEPGGF